MYRYSLCEEIGNGTFGTCYRGIKKTTNEEVAIKKIKQAFNSWDEITQLREFKAHVALSHQSRFLVEMYEIIRNNDGSLYFVCELMSDGSLFDFLRSTRESGSRLMPTTIRSIMSQVLHGIHFIHSRGYIHRDLKPENLLMKGAECKIGDFSLAREIALIEGKQMTSYVATRWYRPPEIILCDPKYSAPVDLFSLGCIMAEMFRLKALFPGQNETEQLVLVCGALGPLQKEWPEGIRLCRKLGLDPSSVQPHAQGRFDPPINRLHREVPTADIMALRLLLSLLHLDPDRRATAQGALSHEWFHDDPRQLQRNVTTQSSGARHQTSTTHEEANRFHPPPVATIAYPAAPTLEESFEHLPGVTDYASSPTSDFYDSSSYVENSLTNGTSTASLEVDYGVDTDREDYPPIDDSLGYGKSRGYLSTSRTSTMERPCDAFLI